MRFRISGALLRFADYQRSITVAAVTLPEALEELLARYPGLRPVLYDNAGRMRRSHRLLLNGAPVDGEAGPVTLAEQDTVEVISPIVGG